MLGIYAVVNPDIIYHKGNVVLHPFCLSWAVQYISKAIRRALWVI